MIDRMMARAWLCGLAMVTVVVAAGVAPAQDGATRAEVIEALDELLARPEYRRLARWRRAGSGSDGDRGLVERLFEPERRSERSSARSRSPSMPLARGFLWLVVTIALAVALVIVLAAIAGRWQYGDVRRAPPDAANAVPTAFEPPPGELPSDAYLERAAALADAGDHRGAVREVLLAGMSRIERDGLIRHRRGLTNHDYVRAVWRHPRMREALLEIVDAFEHIFFGRRPASRAMFERVVGTFRKGFDQDESVVAS